MASNTPRNAFETLAKPLQRAVSLVAPSGRGVLVASPLPLRVGVDHTISFANGEPVRLAGAGLYLECFHDFRIVEEVGARTAYGFVTTGYWYSLLDQDRRELVAYHHHPTGESWCTYPHIHVPTAARKAIGRAHLVTGPVSLQAFIRMLIEDPAIPVVSLRPDWASALAAKGDRSGSD